MNKCEYWLCIFHSGDNDLDEGDVDHYPVDLDDLDDYLDLADLGDDLHDDLDVRKFDYIGDDLHDDFQDDCHDAFL